MEEEEGQRQSTLLVTGWKVERGRASGNNNKGDDNDNNHENVSALPTFYLLYQFTCSEHGAKPWSKPIVCPELTLAKGTNPSKYQEKTKQSRARRKVSSTSSIPLMHILGVLHATYLHTSRTSTGGSIRKERN